MIAASVVIPTFNRARFLPRAIDSALAQTHPCQVVVCDHGSTDGTPEVARTYGPRITYVRREVDQGPIACWRDGVAHATGEVVQINFDDDWTEPAFVSRCLELLADDVAFVYTRVNVVDTGTGRAQPHNRHPAGVRPIRDFVRHLLRMSTTVSPGCALFRRVDVATHLLPSVPGAAGRYGKNTGVGEDALLFLLTSLHYPRYGHVPQALASFSAHPGSITIDALNSDKRAALVAAYDHAKAFYREQPGSEPPRARPLELLDELRWRWIARAGR